MLFTLFCLFAAVILIQIIYYLFIFGKFSFAKNQSVTPKKIPISVIVCAKNEEENVRNFVPLLAQQDYPQFEIVLIDDASSDQTLEVFEEYEKIYPNIKLVKVENNEAFWGNKKFALTLGIKAARYEYLLFTDADCYPVSKNWITTMSSQFTQEKKIVLGYGAYEKIANSFLNKLIRFETLLAATQMFGWAKMGKPYTAVGRNLAYKREEFFKVRGFMDHMKIRSGDDDLFVNQAADSQNTTTCHIPEGFTYSKPKTSFSDWFSQKRRHISTAGHYKFSDRLQLSVFYISQFLFITLSVVLLLFKFYWIAVLSLIVTRYIITWISLGFAAGKLKEKDVMFWYPIMELFLVIIQFFIFISTTVKKPIHWK